MVHSCCIFVFTVPSPFTCDAVVGVVVGVVVVVVVVVVKQQIQIRSKARKKFLYNQTRQMILSS